jgi:N-methylhydantoinase B
VSTLAESPVSPKLLSNDEFEQTYACDRFTALVLTSRMRYLVRHMCTHLMTNAFSPVLRDWYDFAATLSGPPALGYPMAAVADGLLLFTGTMADAVRNVVDEYGPDNLRPGDIVMCNDPYRKGTHVNDVAFIRPVFAEGELAGMITLTAHMMDMGGTVPGGFGANKKNVYENGLVIPPQLLYSEDRLVRPALSLIFDNARFGALMLPDIKSIAGSLRLGERLLSETIERYGRGAYYGALRYATDLGASTMCEGLARLPDGVYEGEEVLDCDGIDASREYGIKVRIVVAGERVEVDLSGSSEQARTCINAGWLDTKTAVAVGLKFLIDPGTPYTSGVCRPIDIVLPARSVVAAHPPDGAIFAFWETSMPILHAIFRALAEAVGVDAIAGDFCSAMSHNATGVRPDGTPWAVVAGVCGGEHGPWGATRRGDGENSLTTALANGIAPSVEGLEAESPVVLLRKQYVTDSSGPGTHRGGAATRKDSLWLTASEYHATNLHAKNVSGFGVRGGGDGSLPAVWQWDREDLDGEILLGADDKTLAAATPILGVLDPETHAIDPGGRYFHFGREPVWITAEGAILRYQTSGGGGFGDPLERDPEAVKRDVRDEYVSIEAAAVVYGVVISGDPVADPEGLRVEAEATAATRHRQRGARLSPSSRRSGA